MTISPGWYQDPAEPSTQRYWDGAGWVGASLPKEATPPEGPPPPAVVIAAATSPSLPSPPLALPPRQPPWVITNQPPVRPHGLALAAPSTRFWARMIDISMVLLLNAAINGWFIYKYVLALIPVVRQAAAGKAATEINVDPNLNSLSIVITLLAMAIWFAYEVPSTAQSGQTLGKRFLRIKVVRAESLDPLGYLRGWRRWNVMGWPLLLLFCCGPFVVIPQILDVMFVAIDRSQRMALHDRSAGTFVVQLPGAAGEKGK